MLRMVSTATGMAPFALDHSFFSYSTAELIESFAYGDAARTPPRDDGHQTTTPHLRLVSVSISPAPDSGT